MHQVKIIADDAVAKLLKRRINAVEFAEDFTRAGDCLLIQAEALIKKDTRRTDLGGVQKLRSILVHQSSEPAAIALFSFLNKSTLAEQCNLLYPGAPIDFFQLPLHLPLPSFSAPLPERWEQLCKAALEEELEIYCAGYRHRLASVMSAARIYLGAALVDHVDLNKCNRVFSRLQEQAKLQGLELDAEILSEMLQRHSRRFPSVVHRPEDVDVWVLDDRWEDDGWKTVFSELPLKSCRGFTTWAQLRAEILRGTPAPTVLLVDCNLGADAQTRTGLELLNAIRSRWQDVSIIFMTAYDDAALALTSLREGANMYFAKALNDAQDRRSQDYYTRLISLISEPAGDLNRQVRFYWSKFVKKVRGGAPLKARPNNIQPPVTFEPMLRLSFYLLFAFTDDRHLLRGRKLSVKEHSICRAAINLIGAGFPQLENSPDKKVRDILRILKKARHVSFNVGIDDWCMVLKEILNRLEDQPQRSDLEEWQPGRSPDAGWPYKVAELKTNATYPGLPPDTTVAAHKVADQQGAVDLVQGRFCDATCHAAHAPLPVNDILKLHLSSLTQWGYDDVAFIDDSGGQSGWFDAVCTVFPGCRTYLNPAEFLRDQKRTSLVVLDLRLPELADGRNALRNILKADESVPIITMSASTESLAALQSLRDGACDFISKTLPAARTLGGCKAFAREFLEKCNLLREYGNHPCRARWQQLYAFRKVKWKAANLAPIRQKINRCKSHRSKDRSQGHWLIPPDPNDWPALLAEELRLLLRIWQQLIWVEKRILPLDSWRFKHVLHSQTTDDLIKMMAILAGVIVERIAQWLWGLTTEESLDPGRWAKIDHPQYIDIAHQLKQLQDAGTNKLKPNEAWKRRNEVLHPGNRKPSWDMETGANVVTSVFDTIQHFGNRYGLHFWS